MAPELDLLGQERVARLAVLGALVRKAQVWCRELARQRELRFRHMHILLHAASAGAAPARCRARPGARGGAPTSRGCAGGRRAAGARPAPAGAHTSGATTVKSGKRRAADDEVQALVSIAGDAERRGLAVEKLFGRPGDDRRGVRAGHLCEECLDEALEEQRRAGSTTTSAAGASSASA